MNDIFFEEDSTFGNLEEPEDFNLGSTEEVDFNPFEEQEEPAFEYGGAVEEIPNLSFSPKVSFVSIPSLPSLFFILYQCSALFTNKLFSSAC